MPTSRLFIRRRLPVWLGGLALMLVLVLPAAAQLPATGFGGAAVANTSEANTFAVGSPANLFLRWDGRTACDGFVLDLPAGWRLERVHLLRYGAERAPMQVRRRDDADNRYELTVAAPLHGWHDVVVQVRTGTVPGAALWTLTPFVDRDDEPRPRRDVLAGARIERSVHVAPEVRSETNRAARLAAGRAEPLAVRREALPDLGTDAPYTVEFWMQTTGLDEVVLSAWDGDEQRPYPFEFVVGANGRLFWYRGRPGEHQSLTTPRPIADGRWHHVALTHDPAGGWSRLLLDGEAVDSLYAAVPLGIEHTTPVALGARLPAGPQAAAVFFSGRLDELRVWPETRTPAQVRRLMRQPLPTTLPESPARHPLVLSFEEDPPSEVWTRPGVRLDRVASGPRLSPAIQQVRAVLEEDAVTVGWSSTAHRTEAFIVERSADGQWFEPVRRLEAEPDASGMPQRYVVRDLGVTGRVVFYRVRQLLYDGSEQVSPMIKVGLDREQVRGIEVIGAYPNPFNPATRIAYEVQEPQHVTITVANLAGQHVAQLVDAYREPGRYEVTFDAADLPSGSYFVLVRTRSGSTSWKVTLAK